MSALLAAAPAAHGSSLMSPWALAIFAVLALLLAFTLIRTLFRHGPGAAFGWHNNRPPVRWFPRAMRPWVNDRFERRGWAKPYDDQLNKIPVGRTGQ